MIQRATISIEELLEHSAWVRALAHRLVADAAMADDMVQDAWLAALMRPPLRGVPVRPWLASVLHNALRMSHRGATRRTARERIAAREEALASASDVVETAARQRELVEALMELGEPYRTMLLLRFFESLPPRRIAERLEISVETVNTRLKRGMQQLRERLDRQHRGDRSEWLAALLPLARAQQALTPGALGWFSMNLKLMLSVCALLLIGAIAWIGFRQPGDPLPTAVVQAAPAASEVASGGELPQGGIGATVLDETRHSVVVQPSTQPPVASAPPLASVHLRGKVIDDLGRALSDVALVLRSAEGGESARVRSGANGEFEFQGPAMHGRIFAAEGAWCTVLCGVARSDARARTPVVVVARRLTLAGRVVDEMGFPLAGVSVRAPEPEGFRTRFHEVLDLSESVPAMAISDPNGLFKLDSVAALSGARLLASFDQFEPHDEELPATSDENLLVTLRRTLGNDGMLRGQVVDNTGQPVGNASVSLGIATQSSDSSGNFVFLIDDPTSMNARLGIPVRTLTAAKAGFLPSVFEPRLENGKAQWPARITLHLGEHPLEIRGHVVDQRGDPIAGVRVFTSDASVLGGDENGEIVLENLLAGAADGPKWRFVQSDAEGAFVLDGLLPRDYRLRAMDLDTLLIAESGPVPAGSLDVELELDTSRLFPRVAGRIVDRDGKPVAHAKVAPMCDAFRLKHMGQTIATSHAALDGTTSDAEGRFVLKNVPTSLVYLRIDGEDIVPLEYGRFAEGDARFVKSIRELPKEKIEELEITVGRRCHLQVELADPGFADEVVVLDDAGDPVELSVFAGNSRREDNSQPIQEGRSDVIACPDSGVMIVLRKSRAEVSRRKLELKPGEVISVRF